MISVYTLQWCAGRLFAQHTVEGAAPRLGAVTRRRRCPAIMPWANRPTFVRTAVTWLRSPRLCHLDRGLPIGWSTRTRGPCWRLQLTPRCARFPRGRAAASATDVGVKPGTAGQVTPRGWPRPVGPASTDQPGVTQYPKSGKQAEPIRHESFDVQFSDCTSPMQIQSATPGTSCVQESDGQSPQSGNSLILKQPPWIATYPLLGQQMPLLQIGFPSSQLVP